MIWDCCIRRFNNLLTKFISNYLWFANRLKKTSIKSEKSKPIYSSKTPLNSMLWSKYSKKWNLKIYNSNKNKFKPKTKTINSVSIKINWLLSKPNFSPTTIKPFKTFKCKTTSKIDSIKSKATMKISFKNSPQKKPLFHRSSYPKNSLLKSHIKKIKPCFKDKVKYFHKDIRQKYLKKLQ